jgi:acylpyruvate hydrolase
MKLVTFLYGGEHRLGALLDRDEDQVVADLNLLDPHLPTSIIQFLVGGESLRRLAEERLAQYDRDRGLPLAEVRLCAPIPNPGKIMCVGINYRDHAEETKARLRDYPTIFAKYTNTVNSPGGDIVIPRVTDQVDYEAELAVVIGRRGRYISAETAFEYVAGYMPFHDVSARDFQRRTSQWTVGKSFDTFAPMGPAMVTVDEVPDPDDLNIRMRLNGEVMQNSNTRHLIFPIPALIEYVSQAMTLDPGDIIATGTPGGVGFVREPPRFLKPGDIAQVEIDGIGVLTNPVVAEALSSS